MCSGNIYFQKASDFLVLTRAMYDDLIIVQYLMHASI